MAFFRAIASRNEQKAERLLGASPELAHQSAEVGATREVSTTYFFKAIAHYVYAGDTALHLAAAAYALEISEKLLANGANVFARNRRGAQPLHYAVDGNPNSPGWNPKAQERIVEYLIAAGADPNSPDKNGVSPLHRAVRTRCTSAVRALLAKGADIRRKTKAGSTALHLAVQNTGRGGTGSAASHEQQREIILLLLKHGARPTDRDARGKSVRESVGSRWVLDVLEQKRKR